MSNVPKDKINIVEALLSVPGMSEKCKVVFHLSRQNILLLSRVIEIGLLAIRESGDTLEGMLSKESEEDLRLVVPELLTKGGLADFYAKIKSL